MTANSSFRAARRGGARLALLTAVALALVLAGSIFAGRWLRLRSPPGNPVSAPQATTATKAAPRIGRGELVFLQYCSKCHGPDGHGDDDAIARQKPPPRDFAARPWRFEVSLDSIRDITRNGIPATAMPAHREALSSDDLEAVAAHAYRLATAGPITQTQRSPVETALLGAGFFPERKSRMAPDLTLSDAAGNQRTLADEHGRIVLLHFWGATCEHCLAGLPKLQQLTDQWREQGLTVLNVCADADTAESAEALVGRISPLTRTWVDDTGLANSQFEVQALPTIWLIDRSGNLMASTRGMKDWQSPALQNLIAFLLSQAAQNAEVASQIPPD